MPNIKPTPSDLRSLMDQFSGGTDERFRYWANPRFFHTLGVRTCADKAGFHWLIDIAATELAPIVLDQFNKTGSGIQFLRVSVNAQGECELVLQEDTGTPHLWRKHIEWTDFPPGDWTFYLCVDGLVNEGQLSVVMCLPQEY